MTGSKSPVARVDPKSCPGLQAYLECGAHNKMDMLWSFIKTHLRVRLVPCCVKLPSATDCWESLCNSSIHALFDCSLQIVAHKPQEGRL